MEYKLLHSWGYVLDKVRSETYAQLSDKYSYVYLIDLTIQHMDLAT
jgi:hypothetical protein